jgi:hypothetical protein
LQSQSCKLMFLFLWCSQIGLLWSYLLWTRLYEDL